MANEVINYVGRQEIADFLKEIQEAQDSMDDGAKALQVTSALSLALGFSNPLVAAGLSVFTLIESYRLSRVSGMLEDLEDQFETYKDYIQDGICETIKITLKYENVTAGSVKGWLPTELPTGQILRH